MQRLLLSDGHQRWNVRRSENILTGLSTRQLFHGYRMHRLYPPYTLQIEPCCKQAATDSLADPAAKLLSPKTPITQLFVFFKPRRNLCESQCNFHLSCRVQRLCHTTRCCTYRDLHKTLIVWNCLLDETAVFVNQSTLAGSAIPSCIQSRPTPPCSFPHPHPAPTPQTHQTCSFLVSSESFCQQLVPTLFQPTIYVKLISTSTTTA